MSANLFVSTRTDGRSDAQVVIDLVGGAEPGRLYTFAELGDALSAEAGHRYEISAVRAAIGRSYTRLLRECQRTLFSVRGIGYRVAQAKEHNRLALVRKRRADVQLRRGLVALKNVRWDELDPNSRAAHEGTLLVLGAIYEQQTALERRQRAIEKEIREMREAKQ